MSQAAWIVALSAVAVVSAVLSFVAWSLLARQPRGLPSVTPADDDEAQDDRADQEGDVPDGRDQTDGADTAAT